MQTACTPDGAPWSAQANSSVASFEPNWRPRRRFANLPRWKLHSGCSRLEPFTRNSRIASSAGVKFPANRVLGPESAGRRAPKRRRRPCAMAVWLCPGMADYSFVVAVSGRERRQSSSAVLRRNEQARFSSASDDEVGGFHARCANAHRTGAQTCVGQRRRLR